MYFIIKFLNKKISEEDWETPTTTAPKATFNVAIKLVKLGENFVVPPSGSPDFDALANTVTSGFKKTLTKLPEFYKISVDQFSQYVNLNYITRFHNSMYCKNKLIIHFSRKRFITRGLILQ